MSKTKEDLDTLKKELETLEKKVMELNKDELAHIAGGMIKFDPLYEILKKHTLTEYETKNSPLLPHHNIK